MFLFTPMDEKSFVDILEDINEDRTITDSIGCPIFANYYVTTLTLRHGINMELQLILQNLLGFISNTRGLFTIKLFSRYFQN